MTSSQWILLARVSSHLPQPKSIPNPNPFLLRSLARGTGGLASGPLNPKIDSLRTPCMSPPPRPSLAFSCPSLDLSCLVTCHVMSCPPLSFFHFDLLVTVPPLPPPHPSSKRPEHGTTPAFRPENVVVLSRVSEADRAKYLGLLELLSDLQFERCALVQTSPSPLSPVRKRERERGRGRESRESRERE